MFLQVSLFSRKKSVYSGELAIGFAALGVFYYIYSVDVFPWIGLVVGFSFASYGILRKFIQTSAVPGLLMETLLLVPLSLGFVIYLAASHKAQFLNLNLNTDIYLGLAGLVTVVPLILFTAGARLLPMATTGILFYITPSMQFFVGAYIFKEEINPHQLIGFIGIWIGLALYTISLLKRQSGLEAQKAQIQLFKGHPPTLGHFLNNHGIKTLALSSLLP